MLKRWVGAAAISMLAACGAGSGSPAAGGAGSAGAATGGAASGGGVGGASSNSGGSSAEAGAGDKETGGSAGSSGAAGGNQAGSTGTPLSCSGDNPFGTPKPLATLNTTAHEAGARLTPDERMVAFLRVDGDATNLYIARRASRTVEFEAPTLALLGGGVSWLSDDGLLLLHENDQDGQIFGSTRESLNAEFDQGAQLAQLDGYGDPYVVGGANGRLYLSGFGFSLFVSKLREWVPDVPEPIPGGTTIRAALRPTVTTDELTMYFGSQPAGAAMLLDIWVKRRDSKEGDFGGQLPVSELNTPEDEFPSFVSPDGCRLYFDRGDVEHNLYVAEREP